jgi:hypothetical protein
MLLMEIEAMYPGKRATHLFRDIAPYHLEELARARSDAAEMRDLALRRPAYRLRLDMIDRLWWLMHNHITHAATSGSTISVR